MKSLFFRNRDESATVTNRRGAENAEEAQRTLVTRNLSLRNLCASLRLCGEIAFLRGLILFLCIAPFAGCQSSNQPTSNQSQPSTSSETFTEAAQASGIDFTHFNGMSGEFYFPEIMGAGSALFDFDNDGDLDVYLVQGSMLGTGKTISDATVKPHGALQGRLYRNELKDGKLLFTDVTAQSGIVARLYGMGATTGDFDNDGWADLLLTGLGEVQLWRNNGNGTFADATKKAGIADAEWSVSAAFVDYDRDGWLDLFICNYVNFVLANNKRCYSPTSRLDYCAPRAYSPMPSMLFHNKGNGTFENVSAKSGIAGETSSALGVVCADFNEDGWPDIYVANDQRENFLWLNQQNGTFKNDALLAGCAVSRDGKPEASMGVDAGDFDADGDEDLFITHLSGEKSTFYYNIGKGMFEDRSFEVGIGSASMNSTGFGTMMFDYDNDGWLDVLAVNGAVTVIEAQAAAKDPFPFHQSNQLYRNKGDSTFQEVTAQAGAVFKLSEVGRGAAFGDVDNDGDTDVLITNNNGRARLLLNQVGNRQHWLGLKLVDAKGKDALGARVTLVRNQKPALLRRARTDGSYASANDARVLFGLGASTEIGAVRVTWPSGKTEEWSNLIADKYASLREGSGKTIQ